MKSYICILLILLSILHTTRTAYTFVQPITRKYHTHETLIEDFGRSLSVHKDGSNNQIHLNVATPGASNEGITTIGGSFNFLVPEQLEGELGRERVSDDIPEYVHASCGFSMNSDLYLVQGCPGYGGDAGYNYSDSSVMDNGDGLVQVYFTDYDGWRDSNMIGLSSIPIATITEDPSYGSGNLFGFSVDTWERYVFVGTPKNRTVYIYQLPTEEDMRTIMNDMVAIYNGTDIQAERQNIKDYLSAYVTVELFQVLHSNYAGFGRGVSASSDGDHLLISYGLESITSVTFIYTKDEFNGAFNNDLNEGINGVGITSTDIQRNLFAVSEINGVYTVFEYNSQEAVLEGEVGKYIKHIYIHPTQDLIGLCTEEEAHFFRTNETGDGVHVGLIEQSRLPPPAKGWGNRTTSWCTSIVMIDDYIFISDIDAVGMEYNQDQTEQFEMDGLVDMFAYIPDSDICSSFLCIDFSSCGDDDGSLICRGKKFYTGDTVYNNSNITFGDTIIIGNEVVFDDSSVGFETVTFTGQLVLTHSDIVIGGESSNTFENIILSDSSFEVDKETFLENIDASRASIYLADKIIISGCINIEDTSLTVDVSDLKNDDLIIEATCITGDFSEIKIVGTSSNCQGSIGSQIKGLSLLLSCDHDPDTPDDTIDDTVDSPDDPDDPDSSDDSPDSPDDPSDDTIADAPDNADNNDDGNVDDPDVNTILDEDGDTEPIDTSRSISTTEIALVTIAVVLVFLIVLGVMYYAKTHKSRRITRNLSLKNIHVPHVHIQEPR
eukprot:TRINITY_DN10662_c0_g1_i1.p1 TRINITY_DN10662_c0_g1~~TRINITY_DN10662_c0_g1_i1.p1  ORF type:complete len:785 (-),score=183.84 TRINITY_DN10662_c0_g1_i1:32-2356(-)